MSLLVPEEELPPSTALVVRAADGDGDGGGGGGGDSKEGKASAVLTDITNRLPPDFVMIDIRTKVVEPPTPYVIFFLQEIERINGIIGEIRRALAELELGLSGALNISDLMDALITNLSSNTVPPLWLKMCGQIGPTGTYNRKNMANWYIDLLDRYKQLKGVVENNLMAPPSVWLSGLFNPMGYVTACLQVTARAKSLPLDSMKVSTDLTAMEPKDVAAQPAEGTYVHGLYMEGARWDKAAGCIAQSNPKVLHTLMPVMHIMGVTADKVVTAGMYTCPVYMTTIRGPTFTFAAGLVTKEPPSVWVLAAVALVMQPDP